jgi:hypothetical protein
MSTEQPQERQTEYGMDMSLPEARARWKQILSWVKANLAPDNPEFGVCQVHESWKPQTKEERVEERFLRQLLLAKTADAIGRACCPAFLIKGLTTPEDEARFGAVELEDAFRHVAKSFNLTDAEAYQAREFADTLRDKDRVMWGADEPIFTCAEKFNVIRRAVETAQRLEQATKIEATAEASGKAAARAVLAEKDTDAGRHAPAVTASMTVASGSNRFQVLDPHWQCVRVERETFNLKDRAQIKRAMRFLLEKGYTSATGRRATVKAVCRAAGQKAQVPNLHGIFHVAGGASSPDVDYDRLYDLAIDCQRSQGVWLKV